MFDINFFQRLACEQFEKSKDGSCKLFRMKSTGSSSETDPPATSPSPHIVAVLVDRLDFT